MLGQVRRALWLRSYEESKEIHGDHSAVNLCRSRRSLFICSERWRPQSRAMFLPALKDRACWELTDPVDVGPQALFRVSRFPMPNNEESDENPDQRRYQEELAHKTALLCFI